MNLKDNLKKIRKENNLSQEELAEKLGVSRQSVSKWESGQAYPEMDKMLELCKIFNLNIDDLLNQDISEIKNNNQIKNTINKYADDFLGYITKTIKMFSAMKFRTKIKCIFEELIIIGLLIIGFLCIGAFLRDFVISNIFSFLPDKIYFPIGNLLTAIYFLGALVLGIIVVLHIFKIRYLDYYIVEEPSTTQDKNSEISEIKEEKIDKEKEYFKEEQKEKIIIRDPKHSEYKFIKGLIKLFVIFLKITAFFIALGFIATFIAFIICTFSTFIIIKSGLLFLGLFLLFLSLSIINYVILVLFYNFIFNHKSKKKRLAIIFLLSLIIFGASIAIIPMSATKYEFIKSNDNEYYIQKEQIIEMKPNTTFIETHRIKYIEENRKDIRLVLNYTKYEEYEIDEYNGEYRIYIYFKGEESLNLVKDILKMINKKEVLYNTQDEILIYTSKENIEKLKENSNKYYNQQEINQYQERIDELENEINRLNEENL